MKYSERPCSQCGAPRAFIDGAWLRKERTRAGLSLREVAKRLGYTTSYVCDIELNRRNANEDLAGRYLLALNA